MTTLGIVKIMGSDKYIICLYFLGVLKKLVLRDI